IVNLRGSISLQRAQRIEVTIWLGTSLISPHSDWRAGGRGPPVRASASVPDGDRRLGYCRPRDSEPRHRALAIEFEHIARVAHACRLLDAVAPNAKLARMRMLMLHPEHDADLLL